MTFWNGTRWTLEALHLVAWLLDEHELEWVLILALVALEALHLTWDGS